MFRPRPLLKNGLPTNALGRNGQGLPGWASSSDFRDFEDGADGRLRAVQYGGGAATATDDPFASQIADGVRATPKAGFEQVGMIARAAKPQIIQEAKKAGFTDQEAQALFEAADKIPDLFWMRQGRGNTNVTPANDKDYRDQAERVISNPDLRKKALEFYERQFAPGGRLRRIDKE